MAPTELQTQLEILEAEQAAAQQEFDARRAALLDERRQIQAEQLRLQQRLDAAIQAEKALSQSEAQQSETFAAQQHGAIITQLEQCRVTLERALAHAAKRQHLIAERTARLEREPDLHDQLASYEAFEANQELMLRGLPEFHRNIVLKAQEDLKKRLQPLMALDDAIRQASPNAAVELICPVYINQDNAEMVLVIPVLADVVTTGETSQDQLARQAVEGMQKALFEMGKGAAWEVAAMEERTWSGFVALELLAEYVDDTAKAYDSKAIAHACEVALAGHFEERPSSAPVPLSLQLVPVSGPAWRLGMATEAQTTAPGKHVDELLEDELEETLGTSAEETPLADNRWYSEDDIRAWQRQLRVAADSKWNRTARRMRTLLMRLVAHGMVGERSVPASDLWQPLPGAHADAMRTHIDRLLDQEVLLAEGEDAASDTKLVSVNPTLLEEVQNLINRTISPFWEELVTDAEPTATA